MSDSAAEAMVRCERHGAIARVVIDRPKALNALNSAVLAQLEEIVEQLGGDGGIHVVVLAGGGERSFVAGADIAEMVSLDSAGAQRFAERGQRAFASLEAIPQPVIAEVQGFALGGGLELAMACDLIAASSKALFGQPEIDLGIIPGFGGTQRLARRVGAARAKELVWTGRRVSADEALRIGLIDQLHAPEALREEVDRLATALVAKAPGALRQAKRAIVRGLDCSLEQGLALEADAFAACFATADAREGMSAFLEKRPARFGAG